MICSKDTKLDDILYQIQSIKDNSKSFIRKDEGEDDIWVNDVIACSAMQKIIKKIQSKGCNTVSEALEYIGKEAK